MTCHRNSDLLLQVSCLGLVGILAVAGCGGSSGSTPDAKPRSDSGTVSGPEVLPAPALKVSSATLAFGEVDINQASTPMSVTVTNTGSLVALSPTVDGTGFALSSTTCGTAAASCSIAVVFTPTTASAASGTLTVAAGLTVSLSGIGRTPGTFTATSGGVPATLMVNQSAPVSVTITATAALTGLTCLPSGADLTVDPVAANTTCTGTVAASTPCVYGFVFKSATSGAKSDSIVCSAAGTSRTVLVNPTVVTPAALTITPNPGSFTAAVGSASPVITFNVANSGGTVSGALNTTLTGANLDQFTITDNKCVVPLASLGVCSIQVVFSPTSAGTKAAGITVTDATVGSTPAATVLTGTALAAPTAVVTGAATLGSVAVGKAGTASTFTITNSGGATTGALSLSADDPEFAIGGGTCSGQTLAAAKTCTFTVTFSPTSVGDKSAVLSVSAGATVLGTFQIGGTGTIPPTGAALGMTPPQLDFGTIGVGTVSATQTFTVTNTGGTATGALSVTNTGVGGASQFTFTTTCQAALAAAATCQVVVTFKPTIAGSASATFTVTDGTVSSPARTVVGTALDRPGVGIACAPSPAFPDTVVGQTSTPVVCTVTNDAASKQGTGAITATPTGDFAVPTNNCTASLDPGLSCTLSVVFKPTAAGARTGTLTVTGANGGAVNQNLTGTGLGIIDIQEFTMPAAGFVPTSVDAGNYDFGSVSAGAASATTVVLAVYIRAAVGNLSVAEAFGTPADFALVAGAVDLTWPGTATHQSVGACVATTTTAPTASATVPYCTLKVSFTPQTKGAKTGTVTATGADGTTKGTATVKGTAAGPISINPSQVTFSAVAPGTAGPPTILQVCNNAATQATAAQFAITGTNAGDFAVTLDQVSNATIGAHACVNLAVSLDIPAAETATAPSATLTVSATVAGATESDTTALVGVATGGPVLQASLGGSVFDDTPVTATSAPVTVTVSNTGGLGSGALTFDLPTGSEFALRLTGQDRGTCASTCSSDVSCTAGALAAGSSCTLKLWFSPSATLGVGPRTDLLRVGSASGAISLLPLSANAQSQFTATPDTVALGPSGVATVGAPIQTVTIKNVGADSATALTVAFSDFGAQTGNGVGVFGFNPATPDCVGPLAAGDTCTIGVQMVHPAAVMGPFSTTLVVTNTGNGQSVVVGVTGTAAQSILRFTPATDMDRDFGTEPMGNTSGPVTYTVTNVGSLTSGKISWGLYDNPLAATPVLHAQTLDFTTVAGTTPCVSGTTALAPGASCNITLEFSPTACSPVVTGCTVATAAALNETLIVTAAPGTPTAGLMHVVTATTNKVQPTLYIAETDATPSKAVHDFGTTPATVTLALYNAGNAAYTVPTTPPAGLLTDLGLAGTTPAAAGEFALVTTNTATTCQFARTTGAGVTSLAAAAATQANCTFNVAWAPGTTPPAGTRAVSVALGGASMVLYGRVVGPAVLVANPSSLSFGDVAVGDNSPQLTVTVTNVGESTMTANLARTIPAGVDYVSGCTGTGLIAGASCTIVLDVQPAGAGAGTANVVVRSSTVASQSVTIPVSWNGTNTNPAAITLTPATSPLPLGSMPVLATSAPVTVTVTNAATNLPTGPLSFTVNNADGSPNFDFAVNAAGGAGNCGDIAYADGLNGGQSCAVTVTFTPRTLATPAKTATLTVKTNAATTGLTATKVLSGTAVAALSVSADAVASSAEDPLVAGGCTFTDATGTTPALCAYGTRAVAATTFRSQTITFQNAAGSPTTGLLVADVTGTGAAQFKIVDDTCTGKTVAGGATCKVTVRFSPTTTGAKTAALSVSGTPGDTVSVNLTGTGN